MKKHATLTPLLLCSCATLWGGPDPEKTAAGLSVNRVGDERGSFSSGRLAKAKVFAWLDTQVGRWAESRSIENGKSRDELWKIARGTTFRLVDDWHFQSKYSPTGWAAGSRLANIVAACIWEGEKDGALFLPADGVGLSVVPHEMDHVAGFIEHDYAK